MTATEFNADRIAATTRFHGLKNRRTREALLNLTEHEILAVIAAERLAATTRFHSRTREALPNLTEHEILAVIAARKRIHALRLTRAERRRDACDSLIARSATRAGRLEARRMRDARMAVEAAAMAEADAIRDTMIAAARVARSMGFTVRASKNRAGRISSYYCRREGCGQIRISDHEIPWTPAREAVAYTMAGGGFDGYHGGQLIIDCKRSATWLRRALTLIAAGRSV